MTQENYLISVIVPIYNIEQYLEKCIQSIRNQTYRNLEIILVDDGSTDSSSQICDQYAAVDDRVVAIHKENKGLVSARKAGLDIAVGDYVGFVDGDDYIEINFYETLLQDILEYGVDFVHTGYVYEQNEISTQICRFESRRYKLSQETVVNLIEQGLLGKLETMELTYSIWSKLFEREFIKKCYARVPDEQSQGEDLVCFCVALLEGSSVYLHQTALYHYMKRPDSMTNTIAADIIVKAGKLYCVLKDIFVEYGVYEKLRQCLDDYLIRMTIACVRRIRNYADYISCYYLEDISKIRGKRVIIYGAGSVGQAYYTQLRKSSFCDIVGWIDADYRNYKFEYAQVMGIEQLEELQYDVILIAIKSRDLAERIRQELIIKKGIEKDKVVWEMPKSIL